MDDVRQYAIRCYRETPGDAGCGDIPAFADTLDGAIELAEQMLRAFASVAKSPQAAPLIAALVDEVGNTAARVRFTDDGAIMRVLD